MADEKTETHETPDGGTETTKTSHSESRGEDGGNVETTEKTTTSTEASEI